MEFREEPIRLWAVRRLGVPEILPLPVRTLDEAREFAKRFLLQSPDHVRVDIQQRGAIVESVGRIAAV